MRHLRLVAPSIAAAALVLASAGCEGNVIVDDWPTFTVEGRVVTAGGSAVRDAQVEVRVHDVGCTSPVHTTLRGRTDGQGRFTSRFDSPRGSFDACFAARITPPPVSSLPAADVTVDSIHAVIGSGHEGTIEVTFTLP